MRVRMIGLPPYLPQMDDMFQGNTVDATTSFVPAATQRTELNVLSSDEEGAQEEDTLTLMSLGTKRPSSTITTASSPNKKSKSPAVRAMNMHMTSHLQMAKERLEFQKEMHKENKLALENLRLGVSWKIAECTRIAEKKMGISAATPTLLDGLIKMAKSEADMDMFLSTTSEPMRMRILENLGLKTGPVDN